MDENEKNSSEENATSESNEPGSEANIEEATFDVEASTEGAGLAGDLSAEGGAGEDSKAAMPPYTEVDPFIRKFNMGINGVATIHYPARDVQVSVDGDSAMRLLSMFQSRSDARWKDYLDPRWAQANSGWLVLDLSEPLAISYAPAGTPTDRTAIDPVARA